MRPFLRQLMQALCINGSVTVSIGGKMSETDNILLGRILLGFVAGALFAGLLDLGFFWSIGLGIIGAVLSGILWK